MKLNSISPSARRYLVQEAVLILVISYLVLFGSTDNGLLNPTIIAITAVLLTVAGGFLVIRGQRASMPVILPLQIFLFLLLITCLTSIDSRRSLAEVWLISVSALLFILIVEFVQRGLPGELVIKVLLIVVGVVMAFAWWEAITWYMQWLKVSPGKWIPTIAFRLSLPNFLTVMLNVLLMMAVARFTVTRSWIGRTLLILWVVSALGLIYLSSSRSGWLGTGMGLLSLVMISYFLFRKKWLDQFQAFRQRKWLIALIIIVGLVAIFVVGFLLYHQSIQPTHGPVTTARNEFWGPAWNAFIKSPIFGQGPFTFISFYLQANPVPPYQLFVYSHSIYLDLLSGSGLVGFAGFVWLVYVVVRYILKRITQCSGMDLALVAGAGAALAAFLVHGIFDSVHHTIPTSLVVFVLVMGASLNQPVAAETGKVRRNALYLVICVVGFAWWNWWAIVPMQKGVEMANSGQGDAAVSDFQTASQRDPSMAIAHQQYALTASVLAANNDSKSLQVAISEYEKTIKLDPYWAINQANLGALYKSKSDMAAAEKEFKQAVTLSPQCVLCWLNYGATLEVMDNFDGATQAYQKVFELEPDWVEAFFWRETAFRAQVQSDWKKNNPITQPDEKKLLDTLAFDPSRAYPYIDLANFYIRNGQLDKAKKMLDDASLTYFHTGKEQLEYYWAEAELEAANGNYKEAVAWGEKSKEGYLNQGVFGPGSSEQAIYAPLMFRRPAMRMELTPQLIQIIFPDSWGARLAKMWKWYSELGDSTDAAEIQNELLQYIPDYSG